jgi:hypothetical protein
VEELKVLLGRSAVRTKIDHLGLRFVVAVSGGTTESEHKGGILCGAGPQYGGCLGFEWWDRETNLKAVVWDLKQAEEVEKVDVSASGTALMPAFAFPIPLIPTTETEACSILAKKIAETIARRF